MRAMILFVLALIGSTVLVLDTSHFFNRFAQWSFLEPISFGLIVAVLIEAFIAVFSMIKPRLRIARLWVNLLVVLFSLLAVGSSAMSSVLPELEALQEQWNLQKATALKKESLNRDQESSVYLQEKGQTVNYILTLRNHQKTSQELTNLMLSLKNENALMLNIVFLIALKVLIQIGTITLYGYVGVLTRKVEVPSADDQHYANESTSNFAPWDAEYQEKIYQENASVLPINSVFAEVKDQTVPIRGNNSEEEIMIQENLIPERAEEDQVTYRVETENASQEIKKLQEQLQLLTQDQERLTVQLHEKEADILTIKQQNEHLQTQIVQQEGSLFELQHQADTLTQQKLQFQKNKQRLQKQLIQSEQERLQLFTGTQELHQQIQRKDQELEKAKFELETLMNNTKTSRYENLYSSISSLSRDMGLHNSNDIAQATGLSQTIVSNVIMYGEDLYERLQEASRQWS